MTHCHFYNGILYKVEYQPKLSNNDYTEHKVYHIETKENNHPHARKAIASIMEDILDYKQGSIWSYAQYQMKNKQEPSMLNALHMYYRFTYDEKIDRYVYTLVIPYDD